MVENRYNDSTHNMVGDIRHEARVGNFLSSMQFGAMLAIAANQRRTNDLVAEGNMLQNEANDLQYEANDLSLEANRRLEQLGIYADQANRLAAIQARESVESNRTLKRIEEQTTRTNKLLAAQLDVQQHISDQIDVSNRINYATWRSGTEVGRAYMQWEETARETISRIGEYSKRMADARAKDLELNMKTMIANDPQHLLDEHWKPALPTPPEQPAKPDLLMPAKPTITEPVAPTEPEYPTVPKHDPLGNTLYLLMVLVVVFGVGYGLYHGWTSTTHSDTSGFFGFISGAGDLLHSILNAVLWGLICGAVSLVPAIIFAWLASKSSGWKKLEESNRALKDQYKQRMGEYYAAKRDYDDTMRAYKDAVAARHRVLAAWQTAVDRWRAEYGPDAAVRAMERHRHDVDAYLDACAAKARASLPPNTHWAVENPMEVMRTLTDLIERVPANPLLAEHLPDPGLPAFATIASLPACAPHMRAELFAILMEHRDDPDAMVRGDIDKPVDDYTPLEPPAITVTAERDDTRDDKD